MTRTPPTPPPKPSVHLDWEDWLPFLAESDATDAEKRQLIETLWSIVWAFVDLGWEVAPRGDTPETRGQNPDITALIAVHVVNSTVEESEDA